MIKFGMYQRVVSKKTGLPMSGTIHGILCGQYQNWQFACRDYFPKRWFDLYPNWPDKPVYIVRFDTPSRTITYEEYTKNAIEHVSHEQYETHCPIQQVASYPEDDLELLDASELTEKDKIETILKNNMENKNVN